MDGTHDVTMLTWALQNVTSKSEERAHLSTVGEVHPDARCCITVTPGWGWIWMRVQQGERYWCDKSLVLLH